ncbi:isocitrate lyase/phosphoenolpyruvate mutase family protein [Curtobacterium sp. MCSS17_005]|uniref:isocitrate lyase/phosphoenolpyruvate mutase family protein n=1 Tax=Curtobacterium sp. MCSS17_005 TaxID=2175641 RepID=UPI000DAA6C57
MGAARRAAERAGVPLFVNARTDVHLAGLVDPERLLAETLERVRRYRGAGADGVFVPGVRDVETIRALVESIDGPVNVIAGPPRTPSFGRPRPSCGPPAPATRWRPGWTTRT